MRIGIVGFGYVGSCIGAVLLSRGFEVVAVDSNADLVESVSRGKIPFNEPGLGEAVLRGHQAGRLRATQEFSSLLGVDVILVCVGTPLQEGIEPDTTQVRLAALEIGKHLRPHHVVILKSTAPPGTTETEFAPGLAEGAGSDPGVVVAFCPERIAEGSALQELRSIPVVVGASDEQGRSFVSAFWEEALDVATISVSSPRTAEMVKLADNQWIDLNIALANELAILSDRIGVDVLEVIDAANSLPKGQHHVNILLPSMGVGGSCLTKDPWFLDHMARTHGVQLRLPASGRKVNDAMPAYTVERMREGLEASGLELAGSEVAILGLAFKSGTGDCRETPVKPVIDRLRAEGAVLRVFDPLVSALDAERVAGQSPESSLETAVSGADCVAFLTGHREFDAATPAFLAESAPGAVIVDGRMYFSDEAISRMKELGLRFRGIGR